MTENETTDSETRWEDTGDICSTCDSNGPHLIVDGELLYCGRCNTLMEELTD